VSYLSWGIRFEKELSNNVILANVLDLIRRGTQVWLLGREDGNQLLEPHDARTPVRRFRRETLGALQALRVDRDRGRKVAADENRPEGVRLKAP